MMTKKATTHNYYKIIINMMLLRIINNQKQIYLNLKYNKF
jgi:hypothetical protein